MENKKQVYSRDGETYMSYEDMMYELTNYHGISASVEVWEADKKEWRHSDFIYAVHLIDDMQTAAMDDCGEIAEEYLDGLTKDQKLELENHIAEWFNKNAKLNFYGVENAKKIVVIVG